MRARLASHSLAKVGIGCILLGINRLDFVLPLGTDTKCCSVVCNFRESRRH
jgi:hypothetical protein